MKYTHLGRKRKKKKVAETQIKTLWPFIFHINVHCLCHLLLQKVYLLYLGKSHMLNPYLISWVSLRKNLDTRLRLSTISHPWRAQASLDISRLSHPFFQGTPTHVCNPHQQLCPKPACRYLISHQQVTHGTEAKETAPQCKAFLEKRAHLNKTPHSSIFIISSIFKNAKYLNNNYLAGWRAATVSHYKSIWHYFFNLGPTAAK